MAPVSGTTVLGATLFFGLNLLLCFAEKESNQGGQKPEVGNRILLELLHRKLHHNHESPPVVVREPQIIREPPQVVVREPQIIREPAPVIVREPQIIREQPPVIVREPQIIREPPKTVVVREPQPVIVKEQPVVVREVRDHRHKHCDSCMHSNR